MVSPSQWLRVANPRNQSAKVAAAQDVEEELGPVDSRPLPLLIYPQTLAARCARESACPVLSLPALSVLSLVYIL
jgi:hypothetical protein